MSLDHQPVMLKEVLNHLQIADNEIYVDGTFGAGGYSSAILAKKNCRLVSLDRDKSVVKYVKKLEAQFGSRFIFKNVKFSQMQEALNQEGINQVDGIVLDIGVSSMQLDDKARGFSFDSEEKLDMRMDNTQDLSAFEVVNFEDEKKLAQIIYEFGDEDKARKIAHKIVNFRQKEQLIYCSQLAQIVRSFYFGYHKIDPATKTFQALRIYVNKELEELKLVLEASKQLLKKGGRLIVVSFHALEDRIVKNFLKANSAQKFSHSRYEPIIDEAAIKNYVDGFAILTKSALSPSAEEIKLNPRSRSAKMRVAIKL